MAIKRTAIELSGTNAAVIPNSDVWATCYRIRPTDNELDEHRYFNWLYMRNNSDEDVEVRMGLNFNNGLPLFHLSAKKELVLDEEAGFTWQGLDIVNTDTATDVGIGDIKWIMKKMLQIPETLVRQVV